LEKISFYKSKAHFAISPGLHIPRNFPNLKEVVLDINASGNNHKLLKIDPIAVKNGRYNALKYSVDPNAHAFTYPAMIRAPFLGRLPIFEDEKKSSENAGRALNRLDIFRAKKETLFNVERELKVRESLGIDVRHLLKTFRNDTNQSPYRLPRASELSEEGHESFLAEEEELFARLSQPAARGENSLFFDNNSTFPETSPSPDLNKGAVGNPGPLSPLRGPSLPPHAPMHAEKIVPEKPGLSDEKRRELMRANLDKFFAKIP